MKLSIENRGFTLIELLVVIAIIGLLSSVILASIQSSRTKAEWRAFEKQLIEIRTAVQLYREKNDGNWPPAPSGYLELNGSGGLIELLKNAGVYGGGDIDIPDGVIAYFDYSYKITENPTNGLSCGHPDYQSVYAVIGFKNYDNEMISETSIAEIYVQGQELSYYGVYYYCIELR